MIDLVWVALVPLMGLFGSILRAGFDLLTIALNDIYGPSDGCGVTWIKSYGDAR